MTEKLSLEEVADNSDFILRRGKCTIRITQEEVLALGASAEAYRQRILSRIHPNALYSSFAESIGAGWDALHENILVEILFPQSSRILVAVKPDNLRDLIERLEFLISQPDPLSAPS